MKLKLLTAALCLSALGVAAGTASAQTLAATKERGAVRCGVNTGLAGFADQEPIPELGIIAVGIQ